MKNLPNDIAKSFQIKPLNNCSDPNMVSILMERWGSTQIVSRGRVHDACQLPGIAASHADQLVGLLTYHVEGQDCEIVSLDSLVGGIGIGSALISSVLETAQQAHCRRVWLVTTNDNLPALRFYQRRGFRLVAIHRNALEKSRQLKSEIPRVGLDGIPLRDEIELEFRLIPNA